MTHQRLARPAASGAVELSRTVWGEDLGVNARQEVALLAGMQPSLRQAESQASGRWQCSPSESPSIAVPQLRGNGNPATVECPSKICLVSPDLRLCDFATIRL